MAFTQIRYDVTDGVCTLTLNRPEKLNAITGTMLAELVAAYQRPELSGEIESEWKAIVREQARRAGVQQVPGL